MATIFDPFQHTYIVHPLLDGPMPIILGPGDRIWVHLDGSDELQPTWVRVADGLTSGQDPDGTSVVSIPQSECQFFTESEAEQMVAVPAGEGWSSNTIH